MVNIKIKGLGNFSFSRVPCVGEKVEIDGHVLTVEEVVHHLKSAKEPSASQNLATLITSTSVSNLSLISDAKNPHLEQKYELQSLEFCQLISCTYRINSEKADKKYKNETLKAVSGLIAT